MGRDRGLSRKGDAVVGYRFKRPLDFGITVIALVLLSPVFCFLWLLVRLKMGSPVLFRQERPGVFGEAFTILKFRTMRDDCGPDGELLPDGKRLTGLGGWLRNTSVDELPELWNVLLGDISLVGPRPLLFRYLPFYTERERKRMHARPGITGLAQVSGRNYLGWDDRLELDVVYVETMSFGLDVKILVKTVLDVVRRSGVSSDVDLVETWLDEERSVKPSEGRECPPESTGQGTEASS